MLTRETSDMLQCVLVVLFITKFCYSGVIYLYSWCLSCRSPSCLVRRRAIREKMMVSLQLTQLAREASKQARDGPSDVTTLPAIMFVCLYVCIHGIYVYKHRASIHVTYYVDVVSFQLCSISSRVVAVRGKQGSNQAS